MHAGRPHQAGSRRSVHFDLGLDPTVAGLLPGGEQLLHDSELRPVIQLELRKVDLKGVGSVVENTDVAEPREVRQSLAVLRVGEADAYHVASVSPARLRTE